MMTSWLWALALCINTSPRPAAEMLQTPESILKERYGSDAVFKSYSILVNSEEAKDIADSLGFEFKDRVFRFFSVSVDSKIIAHAGLLTRRVRTKDQTALYILNNTGEIQDIYLVAFYEPPEYKPRPDWLHQFRGRTIASDLHLKNEIRVTTGATLTALSFVRGTKLIMHVWQRKNR